jgi:hypothetical protein
MSRLAALLLATAVLVGGCGAESDRAGPPATTGAPSPPAAAEPPAEPRPDSSGEAPPPAWVETEAGSRWLGYSTYCWDTTCADFVAPSCGDEHVPELAVRPGETLRFHLGFEPAEVSLTVLPDDAATQFDPGELVWEVTRTGSVMISATAKPGQGGSDASYVGCLRFADPVPVAEVVERELEGPMTVEGSLLAAGDDVHLCRALAESFPPQCPSRDLTVRGLELDGIPGLQRASGVAWTDMPVLIEGTVTGRTLRAGGAAR